ncbi:alpha/beta hydrolase [Acidobacteriota bacterium]
MKSNTKKTMWRHSFGIGFILCTLSGLVLLSGCKVEQEKSLLRFEVSLAESANQEIAGLGLQVPITGRVFVILSRNDEVEPHQNISIIGNPLWGKNVWNYSPEQPVVIADKDDSVRGYPLDQIKNIPPGEYFVQAFLSVYTTFHRADGHILEMHLNSGACQHMFRSPGNAYSKPARMQLDPSSNKTLTLSMTEVIPPNQPLKEGEVLQQGNYDDTEWVKYIKIKSEHVSEFWEHDMYIGANILIPPGYDEHPDVYYPVIYMQGHSLYGWTPVPWMNKPWFKEGDEFYDLWTAGKLPKMIIVSFRDANPYYDTSYSVNSENVGPYGDAITEELIPYLEENFRIIPKPWARVLSGRSTGGWEALAVMVWYPDLFAGTWPWAPDPVDFRKYELINIYEDNNAFYREYEWIKTHRPEKRDIDAQIRYSVKNTYQFEQTLGDKDRSGQQWAIWQAVYSPKGPGGYPKPLWDPETGDIDHEVAEYWKENYDIRYKLEKNWATLGPKLTGKIHVAVGNMDNYYLNEAVYLLQDFLDSTTDPPAKATFQYGWIGKHSWIGHSPVDPSREMTYAEFIPIVTDYITKNAPSGADTSSWKY